MGPTWPFLLMYGSHDMRHAGFSRLTMVNGTPEKWGVTKTIVINYSFKLKVETIVDEYNFKI